MAASTRRWKSLPAQRRSSGQLSRVLRALPEGEWNAERIKSTLWDFATEKGRGSVLWPLRVALTGKEKSPDPFTIAELLGKEETLARINYARDLS